MTAHTGRRLGRHLRRHPGRSDEGFALITVLLATLALILLATAALDYGLGSQPISRHDQDWSGALAAAEGGVDDYLTRINQDHNYYVYGIGNPDPANPAMGTNKWATIGSGPAQFHYRADTSQYTQFGIIYLTSTGRVNKVYRTVQARLGRDGLLKFLYHTTYETRDPVWFPTSSVTDNGLPSGARTLPWRTWASLVKNKTFTVGSTSYTAPYTTCQQWWYAGRKSWSSYTRGGLPYCQDIQFADRDSINGPLSTDDTLVLAGQGNGPTFNGPVTMGGNDPQTGSYYVPSGYQDSARFLQGRPTLGKKPLPSTLQNLKQYVTTSTGGCLFTGPTQIVLTTDATGNSKMQVTSPMSKNTVNGCNTTGASQNLPTNGLVLVQNVPASPSDPNYSSSCPASATNLVNTYMAGDPSATKLCTDGDVILSGVVNAPLTVAAIDNSIVLNGNLCYYTVNGCPNTTTPGVAPNNGDTAGITGLLANNFVEVYHPVGYFGMRTLQVDAAIFAINHSFIVQNYDRDDLDTLTVFGTIGQQFRGPVGTTAPSGYTKNYWWDTRFGKGVQPPYFVDSPNAVWTRTQWAEVRNPALYN